MILEKIPENSKINAYNHISVWNGFLAVIFDQLGFDPKNLAEKYVIEYILGERGKLIKIDDDNKWMLNKYIREASGGERMIDNYFGGYTYFKLSEPETVWLKKDIDKLTSRETAAYSDYLSNIGYVDNTEWQIPKTSWIHVLKKGYEDLEKVDSNAASKMYQALKLILGKDFIEDDIKRIRGVYTLSKGDLKYRNYKLKWIINCEKL